MTAFIGLLLALAVAATWLSALALLRQPRALDRLHAVSFLNVAAGVFVSAAGFAADGVSVRSLKILFLMALLVGTGAVVSHAAGRALLMREGRSAMSAILGFLFLLTAASGTAVVLVRDPSRQIFVLAANGIVLTLLFTALQAPDVALSELAVGAVAVPLLFLVALMAVRTGHREENSGKGDAR